MVYTCFKYCSISLIWALLEKQSQRSCRKLPSCIRRSGIMFTEDHKIILSYYFISIRGPTRCTICFQFITINILYMFRALICSSSGDTVYTIGIFCAYYVCWLLAGLEWSILLVLLYQYITMQSTKH
jgi:hypothetical protein